MNEESLIFKNSNVSDIQVPHVSANQKDESNQWNGGCIDTESQKKVIGYLQARAYCRFMGVKFKVQKSRNIHRFGVDRQVTLG